MKIKKSLFMVLIFLILWFVAYGFLPALSRWITYDVFRLSAGTGLASALEFFVYDSPKVLMLLVLVVFGVGIIRTFFTPQHTRWMLVGKKEFIGNILASLLGVVTPFCTCSACSSFYRGCNSGHSFGCNIFFSYISTHDQ